MKVKRQQTGRYSELQPTGGTSKQTAVRQTEVGWGKELLINKLLEAQYQQLGKAKTLGAGAIHSGVPAPL